MISSLLLRLSVVLLAIGIVLGIAMGIRKDFALAPAHGHLNLIGFMMTFAAGLYYRLVPAAAVGWLPRVQAGLQIVGAVMFPFGLTAMLAWDHARFEPVTIVGSLVVLASSLLFVVVVFRTTRTAAAPDTAAAPAPA